MATLKLAIDGSHIGPFLWSLLIIKLSAAMPLDSGSNVPMSILKSIFQ